MTLRHVWGRRTIVALVGLGAVVRDRQAEADILATETSSNVQAMYTYEDYLAKQLPVIWLPVAYAQLSEINKDLKGTGPQDPLLQIYPENWRWS